MVDDDAEVIEEGEVVDGLAVVTDAGMLEARPLAAVPAVQAAALAATGFVAGAATIVVVSRHRTKRAAKKRKKAKGPATKTTGAKMNANPKPSSTPKANGAATAPGSPNGAGPAPGTAAPGKARREPTVPPTT